MATRAQATRSQAAGAAVQPALQVDAGTWKRSAALAVLCVASAFATVYATHECRELYTELQRLEAARWSLDEEYSRLLLEQSAWASHYRVEQVAEREMSMRAPGIDRQRVLAR
jgi:cell division protein FtsL